MPKPSHVEAARTVSDRIARVRAMADTMHDSAAAHGACERQHLRAAGFTEAEITAYADDARAILSGRPHAGRAVVPAGRREGLALVKLARHIRRCQQRKEAAHG